MIARLHRRKTDIAGGRGVAAILGDAQAGQTFVFGSRARQVEVVTVVLVGGEFAEIGLDLLLGMRGLSRHRACDGVGPGLLVGHAGRAK